MVRSSSPDRARQSADRRFPALSPLVKAIQSVCLRERWAPEVLHQGILANGGWLENSGTRLKMRPDEQHLRTPNVPAFTGMPPSMRKSSLHRFVTETVLEDERVEEPRASIWSRAPLASPFPC